MAIPTIMVITHSIILGVMAHDDFAFERGPCIYSGGTALIPWAAYIFSIFKVFFYQDNCFRWCAVEGNF